MTFLGRLFHLADHGDKPRGRKEAGPSAEDGLIGAQLRASHALENNHDKFIERLNNTLSEHADVVSGKVHMIGLEEIREVFGDRWEKVKAQAHQIARQAIERRLTPADIYTPYGEANYLIVFAGLTPVEARVKCALIAREVSEKLLGTQGSEDLLSVGTVVFKENGVLELKQISDFDALINEFEARWAERQREERRIEPSWKTPEEQEAAWEALTKRIRYTYRPIWSVRNHAVAAYGCRATVDDPGGKQLTAYEVVPPSAPARFLSRLDLLVLRRAAQDLVWSEREGKAMLLIIPAHYETMARTRARVAYVSECQMITAALRRRLLIELVGVEEGVPASRLNELTQPLVAECRGVLLRLPMGYSRFDVIKETKVYACGFDVREGADMTEAELFDVLDRFCGDVERIGRRKYIRHVKTTSLLTAAIGAGFDYVDGDVVLRLQNQLEPAHTLELDEIYFPSSFR